MSDAPANLQNRDVTPPRVVTRGLSPAEAATADARVKSGELKPVGETGWYVEHTNAGSNIYNPQSKRVVGFKAASAETIGNVTFGAKNPDELALARAAAESHARARVPATTPLVDSSSGSAVPPLVDVRRRDRLGSKSNELAWKTIVNQMPPHHTYIEPFLGWGAVMRNKLPAAHSILIDREERKVKNFLLELATVHPTIGSGIVSAADALWAPIVKNHRDRPQRRSRRVPAPNGACAETITIPRTAALIVGDALAFLSAYPWRGDELVYLDPPYVHSTRSDLAGCHYLFEMDDADHTALLAIVKTIPAPVILSGYHSKLYEKSLRGWRVVTYKQATHRGDVRTEYLWCNFPEPVELHDYRWLGRNFRERQDLNRMRQRWIKKLAEMPLLKRRALLAAIKEAGALHRM